MGGAVQHVEPVFLVGQPVALLRFGSQQDLDTFGGGRVGRMPGPRHQAPVGFVPSGVDRLLLRVRERRLIRRSIRLRRLSSRRHAVHHPELHVRPSAALARHLDRRYYYYCGVRADRYVALPGRLQRCYLRTQLRDLVVLGRDSRQRPGNGESEQR